ncbi:MAG: peroxidase-related enzyme [Euryarchaeota archaeon]|nr:peroxidase-related enzyme [Euryarchaeota archaeon]
MTFIRTVPPEKAEGRLKEVYDKVAGKRGAVANVMQVQSLLPETMASHLDMYMDIMYGKGPLSRLEREAIAVAVSAANDCRYCVSHHSDALNKYMKDGEATRRVAQDFRASGLDKAQVALCEHAVKLTRAPASITQEDIQCLRDLGWDDAAILHCNLVAAYFNFVNRSVLGAGVELETEKAEYKY